MSTLVDQVNELDEVEQIQFFEDALGGLRLGTVVKLVKRLKVVWDVEDAPKFGGVPQNQDNSEEEIQTEFNVLVTGFDNKIQAIREVRKITSLSLKDSKTLLDQLPATIKEKVGKEEAEQLKKRLEEVGAVVEVK